MSTIPTRKTISLPAETWALVDEFRFGHRIRRESEAVRMLIEAGYKSLSPETTPEPPPAPIEGKRKRARKA